MKLLIFIAGMFVGFLLGAVKTYTYMQKEINAFTRLEEIKKEKKANND